MRKVKLAGVVPALLTPFAEDESIDFDGLGALASRLASVEGVGALFVAGHAGEVAAVSRSERKDIIRSASEVVGTRVPLLAGVYTDSLAEAIAQTLEAQEQGASAITLFPPPTFADGGCDTPHMPVAWFSEIIAATDAAVVVFQFDRGSGLGYTPETVQALCAMPNVVGVKEGSNDLVAYERNLGICEAADPAVPVLTSNNSWLLPSLCVGGQGILSGSSSLFASDHVQLFMAVKQGDLNVAVAMHRRLRPLVSCFYRQPFINMHTRMKVCLWHMGLLASPTVRRPLLPLGDAEVQELKQELAALGLLPREGEESYHGA